MIKNDLSTIEGILGERFTSADRLLGGSGDSVLMLKSSSGEKYVYKTGDRDSISSQIEFYQKYADLPYLPKLLYSSPEREELVIEYLELERSKNDFDKIKILNILTTDFVNRYQQVDSKQYGFVSGYLVGGTFAGFLVNQLEDAYTQIKDLFAPAEFNSLLSSVNEVYSDEAFSAKYLLHGDFGFHNFFYSPAMPLGVIDPDPIIGHPIYDLLFAYCSTPGQITPESYQECLGNLAPKFSIDPDKKVDYLKIALFKRISSSRKHHPHDLEEYLRVWRGLGDSSC